MNKVSWLDNLGRKKRSRQDTSMENILAHLSKVAIEHERDDAKGVNRFHLASKATEAEIEE